jgi:hypothetical protein
LACRGPHWIGKAFDQRDVHVGRLADIPRAAGYGCIKSGGIALMAGRARITV